MSRRGARVAAVALAAAALSPWAAQARPAPEASRLAEADRLAAAAESRLAEAERLAEIPEEPAAVRAARRLARGEAQYRVGDWLHAAVLLSGVVDEPALRGGRDHPEALFLLADALRRHGACGAARARYAEYLALGATERRGAALSGALDCAVKERRDEEAAALLREAALTFGDDLPAELRYLAAKALYQSAELPPRERLAAAAAAFAKVGGPFQLQARYFLGVILIQQQNLHGSLQWFEACARAEPADARQEEVRELCVLALGRVHAQMGNAREALEWYRAVPWSSPRFGEALYELAWGFVKGEQYEEALRTASFIAELAPASAVAPEATVLQGHLLLKLGRFAAATDAYNHVINTYAPVRDELDAILSMQEDPVRYFDELVGARGGAFDVASVLPPIAVRWASSSEELSDALALVASLDGARRDLEEARDSAARIEALLGRGGGLDAFPALARAHAGAHAIANDAARVEGEAVAAVSSLAEPALPPARAAELRRLRAPRLALEPRLRALPLAPEAADERLRRMRARVDEADRAAFRTGLLVASLGASVTGIETWVERHRAEIDADPQGRQELADELRKHRGVVAGYEEELRALRQDVARARDAAGGADALADEARLRAEYLAAVEAERAVAEEARGAVPPAALAAFERADALRARGAALRSRAGALEAGLLADAGRRAGELRALVLAEGEALALHAAALDGVQSSAKELVGRIARGALEEVRGQFYALVLKADVGIVDVAWSRKRTRLDKIQQLSIQKANEIEQIDREYRAMLREAD